MRFRPALVAIALVLPMAAPAAVFNVTNTNATGPGSLRQAMLDANASADASSAIEFDPGLTGTISPQFLSSDLPLIDVQGLAINGPGRDQLTLDLSSLQRLTLTAGVDQLDLRDLTVSGGLGFRGGCLNSEFGATLRLFDVAFEDCVAVPQAMEAARGGAVYSTGPTQVEDARFTGNQALGEDDGGAEGGALFLLPAAPSTGLTVRRSVFTSNEASSNVNGAAVLGGAIRALGNVDALLEDSAFTQNRALLTGTGTGASGGAVNGLFEGLVLRRNLFHANTSSGSGSAAAISNANPDDRPPVDIENNTFYLNRGNISAASNNGAALFVFRAALRMRNNSFRDNRASLGAGSFHYGGAIDLVAIASNAFDVDAVDASPSCSLSFSAVVDTAFDGGSNYFTDGSCTYFATAGSQHPTLRLEATTFPASAVGFALIPFSNSAVVDGGAAGTSASDWTLCPETDQVGNLRPQDGDGDGTARCTAGAAEPVFQVSDEIFADGFEAAAP